MTPFAKLISKLAAHYGRPKIPKATDPLAMIIYENAGYLVDEARWDAAFAALKKQVGLKPTEILSSPNDQLIEITKLGGIHAELRAARLKEIAQIVLNDYEGDLRPVLQLPQPKAINALKKFPSIGQPGAEKILLFTKTYPILALESNGLRVLLRLGFAKEQKSYSASYAAAQAGVKDQLTDDCEFLIEAHLLLRQHGKELCRRSHPACDMCPLKSDCQYYRASR